MIWGGTKCFRGNPAGLLDHEQNGVAVSDSDNTGEDQQGRVGQGGEAGPWWRWDFILSVWKTIDGFRMGKEAWHDEIHVL